MILITRKSEDKLWWSKDKSNSEQVFNGDFEWGQVMIVSLIKERTNETRNNKQAGVILIPRKSEDKWWSIGHCYNKYNNDFDSS